MGMELMTRFGADASSWARTATTTTSAPTPGPRAAPRASRSRGRGWTAVAVFADPGVEAAETPDGIPVAIERRTTGADGPADG